MIEKTDLIYTNNNYNSVTGLIFNIVTLLFLIIVKPICCCITPRKYHALKHESNHRSIAFFNKIPRLAETRNWIQSVDDDEILKWVNKYKQKYDQTALSKAYPINKDIIPLKVKEYQDGICLAMSLLCIKKFLEELKINKNLLKNGWLDQLKEIARPFEKGGSAEVAGLQIFANILINDTLIYQKIDDKIEEMTRELKVQYTQLEEINIDNAKNASEIKNAVGNINLLIDKQKELKEKIEILKNESDANYQKFLNFFPKLKGKNKTRDPAVAQVLDLEINEMTTFTIDSFLNKFDQINTGTPALLTIGTHAMVIYKAEETVNLEPNYGLLLCDKAAIKSLLLKHGKPDSTFALTTFDLLPT